MWLLKNKKFLGIVSILLAFFVSYLLYTSIQNDKKEVQVVKVASNIKPNKQIEDSMLVFDSVTAADVPSNAITDKSKIIGKYTSCEIYPTDYLTMNKFQDKAKIEDVFLLRTNENLKAVSVTVKSLAAGLSGKIQPGDIVTVKCYIPSKNIEEDVGHFVDYPRLRYLEVAAINNSKAEDTDKIKKTQDKNGTESIIPATITFFVNDKQSEDLIEIENIGNLHIVFAGRGDDAKKLLEMNNSSSSTNVKQQQPRANTNVDSNQSLNTNKQVSSKNTDTKKSSDNDSDESNDKNVTVYDPQKGFDIK